MSRKNGYDYKFASASSGEYTIAVQADGVLHGGIGGS